MSKVIVIGGGVAGLTTAHELAERGFSVELFEGGEILGGKARSFRLEEEVVEGLPAEHGFRFFPGFYKHLPDTMCRIPVAGGTVKDNLVAVKREKMFGSKFAFETPAAFPKTFAEFKLAFELPVELHRLGVSYGEFLFFLNKLWQVLTSCEERRLQEYEKIDWWEFIEADKHCKPFQKYLAIGITRSLVASKAEQASTRTIGDIGIQLLLNFLTPGMPADRVLNGPTNEVWITPWRQYLQNLKVHFHTEHVLQQILFDHGRITGVVVKPPGENSRTVLGDYYVCALPVEVMARHLTASIRQADPSLAGIRELAHHHIRWMNGIQFYLTNDVPVTNGHLNLLDSEWALTAISQKQFWPRVDLPPGVSGILSVDISDWKAKGSKGGPAQENTAESCTHEQIVKEVWHQLKRSLNKSGEILRDENLFRYFLDRDIRTTHPEPMNGMALEPPTRQTNLEPLLVNDANTWHLRPCATTRIPNLFLAADYVRTYTDLATMEGANEAARRAVNGILKASKSAEPPCKLWKLHEPLLLAPLRSYDYLRFSMGLKWTENPLSILETIQHMSQSPKSFLQLMMEIPAAANRAFLDLLPTSAAQHVYKAQKEALMGVRSLVDQGVETVDADGRRLVEASNAPGTDGMVIYEFSDHWVLDAPIHDVWNLLNDINKLHTWWPGVQARILGPEPYPHQETITEWHMTGFLPYTMHFWIVYTEVTAPKTKKFRVVGDLNGEGSWTFHTINNSTLSTLSWKVGTTHLFLGTLSHIPAAMRLMEMNHEYMMTNGEHAAITQLQLAKGKSVNAH